MADLDKTLLDFPTSGPVNDAPVNRNDMTAIQLVSGYSGFGVHTLLSILTTFPKTYKNIIFVSVAVIDSGSFKGAEEIDALEASVKAGLEKYVATGPTSGLCGRLSDCPGNRCRGKGRRGMQGSGGGVSPLNRFYRAAHLQAGKVLPQDAA